MTLTLEVPTPGGAILAPPAEDLAAPASPANSGATPKGVEGPPQPMSLVQAKANAAAAVEARISKILADDRARCADYADLARELGVQYGLEYSSPEPKKDGTAREPQAAAMAAVRASLTKCLPIQPRTRVVLRSKDGENDAPVPATAKPSRSGMNNYLRLARWEARLPTPKEAPPLREPLEWEGGKFLRPSECLEAGHGLVVTLALFARHYSPTKEDVTGLTTSEGIEAGRAAYTRATYLYKTKPESGKPSRKKSGQVKGQLKVMEGFMLAILEDWPQGKAFPASVASRVAALNTQQVLASPATAQ